MNYIMYCISIIRSSVQEIGRGPIKALDQSQTQDSLTEVEIRTQFHFSLSVLCAASGAQISFLLML